MSGAGVAALIVAQTTFMVLAYLMGWAGGVRWERQGRDK